MRSVASPVIYMCTVKVAQYFGRSRMQRTVIFTRSARKQNLSNCCGLLGVYLM
jgi:hypothetical protein